MTTAASSSNMASPQPECGSGEVELALDPFASLDVARSTIAGGAPFHVLLREGAMQVELYAPRGSDPQSPHDRDEVYIVNSGVAVFERDGMRRPCRAGDVIFVGADVPHRFLELSADFETWVVLYGPDRGQARDAARRSAATWADVGDDGEEARIRRALERLAAAWAARSVEGVLALMSADRVYEASVGPEPGTTFRGLGEIRRGLERMFANDAGSSSEVGVPIVVGRTAAWEWRYVWRGSGAERVIRGCDFLEFRDGLIARKSGYRKCLGD